MPAAPPPSVADASFSGCSAAAVSRVSAASDSPSSARTRAMPALPYSRPGALVRGRGQRVVPQPADDDRVAGTAGAVQRVQYTGGAGGHRAGVGLVSQRVGRVDPYRVVGLGHRLQRVRGPVGQPAQLGDGVLAYGLRRGQAGVLLRSWQRVAHCHSRGATGRELGQVGVQVVQELGMPFGRPRARGTPAAAPGRPARTGRVPAGSRSATACAGPGQVAGSAHDPPYALDGLHRLEVDQPGPVVLVDEHVVRAEVDEHVAQLVQPVQLRARAGRVGPGSGGGTRRTPRRPARRVSRGCS